MCLDTLYKKGTVCAVTVYQKGTLCPYCSQAATTECWYEYSYVAPPLVSRWWGAALPFFPSQGPRKRAASWLELLVQETLKTYRGNSEVDKIAIGMEIGS